MSSGKDDLVKQVLEEFTGVLLLKLPLQYICQFYDESYLNNLAQDEAKQVLVNFQKNSKLNMQETLEVMNELFPKFQDVIKEWKTKNEENQTQCDLFLQSQVDFLLSDFRTSVMIKLVSAPDVGLQDLETFLERRKTVLIDIFDKLSKPGEPQSISSVNMKTSLEEKLKCVTMEDEKEIEMEKRTKFAEVDLDMRPKNPNRNIVNRRSAGFKESSKPVSAMQSRPKRNWVVAGIKRKYCIDTSDSNESSEDDYEDPSTFDDSDEEEVVILTPERLQATGSSSRNKSGSGSNTKNKPLKKPFKCTKCSERFSQRNALHMHMRCHNRKARYVCSTCKLSFISNRGLHHHKNLKHREKLLFGCSYCDERFNETLKLKAHVMYRHTDICPFRCPMCGASPTNKYTLAQHIEKMHSESRQAAQRLANQVAVDYLVKETKDEAYRDIPEENINSAVVSHVIKKANLKMPQRTIRKTVRVHRQKNRPLPVKSAFSVLHGSRNGK